jgi:chromosome segregation ATPase
MHTRTIFINISCQARVTDDQGNLLEIRCPCCLKNLDVDDVELFNSNMNSLANPAKSALFSSEPDKVQRDRSSKINFERWKKTVAQSLGEISEYRRLLIEIQSTSLTIKELENAVSEQEQDLLSLKSERADIQTELDDLRHFCDCTKRWIVDAGRIASKKIRINQKNDDLSMSMTAVDSGNRDLRTVERDIDEKREEKDTLMGRIARLNKEMTQINSRVAGLSTQVGIENVISTKPFS